MDRRQFLKGMAGATVAGAVVAPAISIGHAVVLKDNCIGCGTCERHCPSQAIQMVDGLPAVNETRCLGCGACEYYCPARPVTAIYVEGHKESHTEI